MSITILWIQNIPETYETVLSYNGTRLQSGTSKYITIFEKLTSVNLEKYTVLTPTLKRFSQGKSRIRGIEHQVTFVSGHFEQTDQSDRRICYRALIIDAENEKNECSLLNNEAQLYNCTISEADQGKLKKKRNFYKLISIIIIITLIVCFIWILNSQKMLSFFNMTN